jgi:hypothetical protein
MPPNQMSRPHALVKYMGHTDPDSELQTIFKYSKYHSSARAIAAHHANAADGAARAGGAPAVGSAAAAGQRRWHRPLDGAGAGAPGHGGQAVSLSPAAPPARGGVGGGAGGGRPRVGGRRDAAGAGRRARRSRVRGSAAPALELRAGEGAQRAAPRRLPGSAARQRPHHARAPGGGAAAGGGEGGGAGAAAGGGRGAGAAARSGGGGLREEAETPRPRHRARCGSPTAAPLQLRPAAAAAGAPLRRDALAHHGGGAGDACSAPHRFVGAVDGKPLRTPTPSAVQL